MSPFDAGRVELNQLIGGRVLDVGMDRLGNEYLIVQIGVRVWMVTAKPSSTQAHGMLELGP